MELVKLTTTDAFYVLDLVGASRNVGVARLAPKVLVDGAELLARATTYTFALFGVQAGGASAGINTKPEGRVAAIDAFCSEVAPLVAGGTLHLSPGAGLTGEDLAPLGADPIDEGLEAAGAVAAASAFSTGTAAVAGPAAADWDERLGGLWTDSGPWHGAAGFDADVDVLFLVGRAGIVDHDAAATVKAKVVVGVTPVPVTAKAYAALHRAGHVFVPDALAAAAPLLALAEPDGADPVERVAALAAELAREAGEPWRTIVDRAETFLASWQPSLPFGRPLA